MSESAKILIKQYFNSLVQQFITDPAHRDITIVFKDYIESNDSGDTLGLTGWKNKWETLNGIKVPGSDTHKYTISFLNHYENQESWRGTVAHEFAHLYLLSKGDIDHQHDDKFYSHLEKFENWMDNRWGLTPRQDKSGDWNQHVNPSKHEERQKKPCTSCGKKEIPYNTAGECFSCHQNLKKESQERKQEQAEFNRLEDLITNSKDLSTLEKNWQEIQDSPFYSSSKRSFEKYTNGEEFIDNKTELDKYYASRKGHLQPSQNKENSTNDEQREWNRLVDLMKNAKSLSELEQAYKTVKNNPIYDSSKRTIKYFTNSNEAPEDNKKELDKWYNSLKANFPSSSESYEGSYSPNEINDSDGNPPAALFLILGGIVVAFLLWLLASSRKKQKK
jgi:hypothetical protein